MNSLLQDARYAIRSLGRTPRFTAMAVLTLALGIGTNVAIFGVADRVLLRPLAFRDAGALVRLTGDYVKSGATDIGVSVPELLDYRGRTDLFQDVAGLYPVNANLTDVDEPERIEAILASANYFTLLGVDAQIGRVFAQVDEVPGNAELAVITDSLWARRFGRDPAVLGKRIRLDNDPYTIIGVLPVGFHHPGRGIAGECEVFVPAGFTGTPFPTPLVRGIHNLGGGAIARLRPGVSVETAAKRLDELSAQLRVDDPGDYPAALGWTTRVVALQQDLAGPVRPALIVLIGAVGAVLLIACANVANLLLVRASTRSREFAVRMALGASRGRLVRQLLTEGVVLALGGGVLGLLASRWLSIALLQLVPAGVSPAIDGSIDWRVLGFSVALSLATGILFGIWPALQAPAAESDALKESTRSMTASRGRSRARGMLVAAEFALALMLLVVAALFARSFVRLYAVDTGFSADHVLTARLWMPLPNDPSKGPYAKHERRLAFYQPATARLNALPGVVSAGWVSVLPLGGARAASFFLVEGQPPESAAGNSIDLLQASPGYFRALGIDLVHGRVCGDQDITTTEGVAVVSEAFVKRYFPAIDPLGTRIRPGGPSSTAPWLTIVGVVRDVRSRALDAAPPPQVYRCLWQSTNLAMTLVVKTEGDPALLERAVRAAVRETDPELPLYSVRPMSAVLASSLASRRFAMTVIAAFALLALALSAVGVYGVLAYLVEQRTREIGVRVALGATRQHILKMVLGTGLGLASAGIAVGLIGAALIARAVATMLFGIATFDPVSFVAIPAVLLAVAVLACYVPARRATRIDPLVALRQE
jgi:putative ABC transport system permease protein